MGPLRILARTAPNTYRLDLPTTWRVFPKFNVERVRPNLRRPKAPNIASGWPGRRARARAAGAAQLQDDLWLAVHTGAVAG